MSSDHPLPPAPCCCCGAAEPAPAGPLPEPAGHPVQWTHAMRPLLGFYVFTE